jgi:SpoVK/Ycf46/Vps4 family AAA+-type ATPase
MSNILVPYIKAGYPIIYLQTAEENRAEITILEAAKSCKRGLEVWSHTEGFMNIGPNGAEELDEETDPVDSLEQLKNRNPKKIFVFRDLHAFMKVPKIKRLIRDLAKSFRQSQKTLIIVSPVAEIPKELEHDIALLEFSLPTKEDVYQTFNNLYSANKKSIGTIEDDEIERIVQAAMGLTTDEAEAAFSKALVERSAAKKAKVKDIKPISKMVLSEKAEAVKKTGILEYFEAAETAKDVGGLQNLKTWLTIRSKAFSKKARDFKLPMPRGILLVGLPGCGKSLSAKATSNILGVPLIRFDVGRVFGGLVGQSEANLRTAIQTVEAVGNCVLWIDEMDKAFSGMGGGSTDGGTSQRVFGNFITWMQEKTAPVFIVATVNRIEGLPPELLRKGRFDEIFFVGLPSDKERGEILNIHVRKYGRDPGEIFTGNALNGCVEASKDFSGAELEEAVVSGLYSAFYKEEELSAAAIEKAISQTNPLAKSKSAQLDAMAQWASKNAVNASVVEVSDASLGGRQLDL